ncbi:DUF1775 domain-containing protein [Actinoplanes sp. NPDC051346]|uniref:DUF1775 domain-containing protein n=1 Tax=Actinoplanes sp. NPDC051346 TaxID=3155048 RepID=UPI003422456F
MVRQTWRRVAGGAAAAAAGCLLALPGAHPASAHTEITIDPARAGAKNALATVHAEAESETAGVTKVQVFLPVGITPEDVTQVSLPKKWKLTKQQDSYTVAGPALAVGRGAEHQIRIRQLPTYASVTFKVLQSYSDGRTDRWIALPGEDGSASDNPAPTVQLAGGSGAAPTATPSPASVPPSAASAPSSSPATAPASAVGTPRTEPAANESSGTSPLWWIVGAVLVAAVIAAAVIVARRRRPPAS